MNPSECWGYRAASRSQTEGGPYPRRRAGEPWRVVHRLTESGRLQETNHFSGTAQRRQEAENGQITEKKVL